MARCTREVSHELRSLERQTSSDLHIYWLKGKTGKSDQPCTGVLPRFHLRLSMDGHRSVRTSPSELPVSHRRIPPILNGFERCVASSGFAGSWSAATCLQGSRTFLFAPRGPAMGRAPV